MRIKIIVSYDGTDFCGWQTQPNGVSVQEILENAVEELTGERTVVTGSGRTDAGVHAEWQVADFAVTKENVPPERFAKAINTFLPPGVRVLSSERVSDSFNSRKCAKRKTYRYSLYKSEIELPLKERYAVRADEDLDVFKMREVAGVFVGEHDFKCFNASGGGAKNTVRTIYSVDVGEKDGYVIITVTGNGFLYNMVRILAGTLVKAGKGKFTKSDAEKMLSSGKRADGGNTLPARGLCLERVTYD